MGTGRDCIICDFFSGSATTFQAAIELNVQNNKNIKTILIQLPENLDSKMTQATGEALAALKKNIAFLDSLGRPHTLDFLGIERIIQAAAKIRDENPHTTADLGFKHYTLKEPAADTLDKLEKFIPESQGMFVNNNILADFGIQSVLATWLVRDGYSFTAPVQPVDFAGYTGYYMDKHLYLIDAGLCKESVAAIVDKFETDGAFNPENVVLFGYSFVWTITEELKMNLIRLKATEKNLHINFDVRY